MSVESQLHRRSFIADAAKKSVATTAAIGMTARLNLSHADEEPTKATTDGNSKVVIGVMGLSRGKELLGDLVKMGNVEVRYVCDVDSKRAASGAKFVEEAGGKATPIGDFRQMLDDKSLDAFFCAAPNHWHGPAAILGCKAGKHVYVEKPACHNPQEGEWMVAAANKYKRCVQVGTQRRSSPGFKAAIERLHSGVIGEVYLARAYFNRMRGSIGKASGSAAPTDLDYEAWQGPAPRRPYQDNAVHYNWHWFWNWGNGELGNNGVHSLDVCRWGLQVDFPIETASSGGRFCYDDDQETPDTHQVAWRFENKKQISYQGLSCTQHSPGPFVSFYGKDGYLEIDSDGGYKVFDVANKQIEEGMKTTWGQSEHIANFIASVAANDPSKLNQPILSGHKSTLLCHLGNVAYRSNQTVASNAQNGRLSESDLQSKYWSREYADGWKAMLEIS